MEKILASVAGQVSEGRMSSKVLGHLVTHVEKPAIGAISHKSKINFSWIKILNLKSKCAAPEKPTHNWFMDQEDLPHQEGHGLPSVT